MIRDLLDRSSATVGGALPPSKQVLDVHDVVARVVAEHQAAHPTRTLTATHTDDGRGAFDEDRLSQALGNLVDNGLPEAIDARGEAGERGAPSMWTSPGEMRALLVVGHHLLRGLECERHVHL